MTSMHVPLVSTSTKVSVNTPLGFSHEEQDTLEPLRDHHRLRLNKMLTLLEDFSSYKLQSCLGAYCIEFEIHRMPCIFKYNLYWGTKCKGPKMEDIASGIINHIEKFLSYHFGPYHTFMEEIPKCIPYIWKLYTEASKVKENNKRSKEKEKKSTKVTRHQKDKHSRNTGRKR